jgi:hypothetical protein
MKYSSCGMEMPCAGTEKTVAQERPAQMYILGFTGGALGYFVSGIGLGFVGLVAGMVLAVIVSAQSKRRAKTPQPDKAT